MESYEKKYNKAQKWIESIYPELSHEQQMEAESFFPELKESEDERIRKEILQSIRDNMVVIHKDKCIAWLEKQGEQKLPIEKLPSEMKTIGESLGFTTQEECDEHNQMVSDLIMSDGNEIKPKFKVGDTIRLKNSTAEYTIESISGGCYHGRGWGLNIIDADKSGDYVLVEQKPVNKIEPKFKIGDWIACEELNTALIVNVDDNKYEVEFIDGNKGFSHIDYTDRLFHLWTIQDAKDGDVLHSTGLYSDCIFIYNGLDNWKFDEPNGNRAVATGYCCLSVSADNMEFGIQGPDCIEVNTVKPATKIQRDLLEKAMTDAGYRWNPDENKIEKIEQKPDWNKEDEKMLYSAIEYVQTYPAHRNSVVNWLKSLKQRIGG